MLSLLAWVALQEEFATPVRTETIKPVRIAALMPEGTNPWKQGGNPRTESGHLVFEGGLDGDRQVDPQIAVGGGHVVHATNQGLGVYDKTGQWKAGVSHERFGGGIDPKLYFDTVNQVFCYDVWVYWDGPKKKPVQINMSETNNPLGAWNTYSVNLPGGVDGGAIGGSRKWVGYSFPGGADNTVILKAADMKAGKPTTAYHFKGSLGHPVATQDRMDDLHFLSLNDKEVVITRISEGEGGVPFVASVVRAPHKFKHFGWPPGSRMRGVKQRTASGDRNPKNVVLQSGCLWFSHTVDIDGRAGVQWHQVRLDGTFVQSGILSHPVNSYIQTSLAVNKRGDVLVGFQETGPGMYISPRCAYRLAKDPLGTLRPNIKLGEGKSATEGGAWGDYSGSAMDGDNLTDLWTVQSMADEKGSGDCIIGRVKLSK